MNMYNDSIKIKFNEKGEIVSLANARGTEFCSARRLPLVTIQTIKDRNRYLWNSSEADCKAENCDGGISFTFTGGGFTVKAEVAFKEDGAEFRLKLKNENNSAIEWINYPGVLLENKMADRGGDFKTLTCLQEGQELSDLTGRIHRIADYPNKGWDGTYPGPMAMQFLAYYNGKEGLYMGAHDTEHNYKYFDAYLLYGDVCLETELFPGVTDNSFYEYGYPVALKFFYGNWADAAEIYRDFAEKSGLISLPPLKESKVVPEWVRESPVVVIYPVRGDEDIGSMQPNMYYPYTNALPYIEKIAKELDSRLLVLLCHWEGSAPWAPPYVWPPYGDKDNFLEYVKKLHEAGQLVGVYCSGTAWTEESIVDPSYNTRELFEREHMAEIMACGPDQQLKRAFICNGNIRWGYDMCISQEKAKKIVLDEISKLIGEGDLDYIQYYDQNLGGNPSICYSESHGHPSTPGRWIYEEAKALFERSNELIKSAGKEGKVSIGCESAAAEGYVEYMPFNDARNYSGFGTAVPVPVYNYVFHQYVNNYMGNCNTSYFFLDVAENPDFLFYRTAYLFSGGDILTVVLKQDGKYLWDWSSPWCLPDVPEDYGEFVKNLNDWRKNALKDALVYGRMLKPYETACGEYSFIKRDGTARTFPSIRTSRWLTESGEDVTVAVNYSKAAQKFSLMTGDGKKAVLIYDARGFSSREANAVSGGINIEIPARSAMKIIIKNKENER